MSDRSTLPILGRHVLNAVDRTHLRSGGLLRLRRFLVACHIWLVTFTATVGLAQETWEYSPYRVLVWYVETPRASLPPAHRSRFVQELSQRIDVAEGAAWSLEIAAPPAQLATDQVLDEALVTAETLAAVEPSIFERDKLLFLTIGEQGADYRVRAREFDCRTRQLGPPIVRQTAQVISLAGVAVDALRSSFAAMVRIEGGAGSRLEVRLRAGGLTTGEDACSAVGIGDVLQPVIRQNDRVGNPLRIEKVAWTYLQVTERDTFNPNLLSVHVHSGYRSPIRGRVASTREQYGLVVRPTLPTTTLIVEAKATRNSPPRPLSGMEVFSRFPSSDREANSGQDPPPAQLLGYTDWRGGIQIPQGRSQLQVAYIKNGSQLLARLPIVAGAEAILHAQVTDDEARLEAEANVRGFNTQLTDLVAQRRILAAQIRRLLTEDQIAAAEGLLDRLTQLPTRSDMQRDLEQRKNRQPTSADPIVRGRIDRLYADSRRTLSKYLDPSLKTQLLREVNSAKTNNN